MRRRSLLQIRLKQRIGNGRAGQHRSGKDAGIVDAQQGLRTRGADARKARAREQRSDEQHGLGLLPVATQRLRPEVRGRAFAGRPEREQEARAQPVLHRRFLVERGKDAIFPVGL